VISQRLEILTSIPACPSAFHQLIITHESAILGRSSKIGWTTIPYRQCTQALSRTEPASTAAENASITFLEPCPVEDLAAGAVDDSNGLGRLVATLGHAGAGEDAQGPFLRGFQAPHPDGLAAHDLLPVRPKDFDMERLAQL
jgi:hypothetical protein